MPPNTYTNDSSHSTRCTCQYKHLKLTETSTLVTTHCEVNAPKWTHLPIILPSALDGTNITSVRTTGMLATNSRMMSSARWADSAEPLMIIVRWLSLSDLLSSLKLMRVPVVFCIYREPIKLLTFKNNTVYFRLANYREPNKLFGINNLLYTYMYRHACKLHVFKVTVYNVRSYTTVFTEHHTIWNQWDHWMLEYYHNTTGL